MIDHDISNAAGEALVRLRETAPRVHCLTNSVAQATTANGLLAIGAVPSFTDNQIEIADFAAAADAILLNLGTLGSDRTKAMETALEIIGEERKPFVLDPVFVDTSTPRRALARRIVEREPDVVRMNPAEFAALAGERHTVPAEIALEWLSVLAVTGETDTITDGSVQVDLKGGHRLLAQVTATGCLASALVTAFLPVTPNALVATVAGLGALSIAGELAGGAARGPGSFAVGLIDALHGLTPEMLKSRLDIVHESV